MLPERPRNFNLSNFDMDRCSGECPGGCQVVGQILMQANKA